MKKIRVAKPKWSFTEDHDWGWYWNKNKDFTLVDGATGIKLVLCSHTRSHKRKKVNRT